jgi:GNAT superfamily N-acetyltransferase
MASIGLAMSFTMQTIRHATLDDAEALAALGRDTFVETFGHLYPPQDLSDYVATAYDVGRIRADLAHPDKATWLMESGGAPVGYALAGPCDLPHDDVSSEDRELKRLYILASHRGGGAGSRLLAKVFAWMDQPEPRTQWIGVWSGNDRAQKLYARHGFTKVGEYIFPVGRVRDQEFILRRLASDPRPA